MMAQCIQCVKMNLNDKDKYGDAFCKYYRKYYDPYSSACSHIEYSDSSLRNREDEYENEDSGCYLTTAMCKALGYNDQCVYLQMLRCFRDTYMMQVPECYPLLVEYELMGPMISRQILQDKEVANMMLDQYISKSIMYIKKQEYQKAIDTYKEMFYFLKNRYHLNHIQVDLTEINFNNEEKLDKQKIRTLAKSAKIIGR